MKFTKTKAFVKDILPFAAFGILYDLLRYIPKGWAGSIHVAWPHQLESFLFGFTWQGQTVIPNDFFRLHTHTLLDLTTAITYSLHIVVPLGFFLFAWFKERPVARQFAWCFLIANLAAFATYILLPVAPPWYVEQYGLGPGRWDVIGDAAGLKNFDLLIGVPYFQNVYAKSAWVHGAVPSMHAGFPLLVVLFAHKILKKGVIPLYFFMFLVWFSAVYLRHHYIIDLLAGALYVSVTFLLYEKIRLFVQVPQNNPPFRNPRHPFLRLSDLQNKGPNQL